MNRFGALLAAGVVMCGAVAFAEPMAQQQGNALLDELHAASAKSETLTVKADAKYALGSSDAPLTLVAYTDYQCPFCGRFEAETFPEIKKYIASGKLRFILRDLPMSSHLLARKAAQAVRCAGEQGKYWEMSETVFKNQKMLDVGSLAGYARQLSLDGATFERCMADDKHLKAIADEVAEAHALGIHKTPTFVLGKVVGDSVQGKLIVGAQPLAAFEASIKEMLEK
ncbi:MAG: thioredoxin domain-containing protein [Sideroxydans sp.]|nr:thioredoxin domain-containing protein [Sideroxydans sp.]